MEDQVCPSLQVPGSVGPHAYWLTHVSSCEHPQPTWLASPRPLFWCFGDITTLHLADG